MDRFAGRPRRIGARAYAGLAALVVVAIVALALAIGVGQQAGPVASPSLRPVGERSSLDKAMAGIAEDGTWSTQTALAVFAASFGPLPGVDAPSADRSYHSGTTAIEMVAAHWSELTDEQRTAIDDYIGPAAAAIVPADFRQGLAALFDVWQTTADQAAAEIGSRLGHPLGIPIRIVFPPKDDGTAWAWAEGNYNEIPAGSVATACVVSIPPSMLKAERAPYIHWLMLHEVWHCFEARLVPSTAAWSAPKWVSEGQASWVAEAITNGAGAPPPESDQDHWRGWLTDPAKTLYSRSYDAVGFWAQLAYSGTDPWTILESSYLAAATKGSPAGLSAADATTAAFVDGWGSSYFRSGVPTAPWAMTSVFGILPAGVRPAPQAVSVGDGEETTITAGTNSAAVADLGLTAFVTEVDVSGYGRVGSDGGFDRVLHTAPLATQTIFLCTTNSGDCDCPASSEATQGTAESIPGQRHGAVTGREDSSSFMHLKGISKDEWCRKKAPPASPRPGGPCQSGCGGSNGDPHLRTIDGTKYDLQAAGEYVLLRSADGATEIQARQEPPCIVGGASPPPSFGRNCQASINTAMAVKLNGHHVGFYVANGPPTVRVDGTVVDASEVASADLGAGAALAAYKRGYELDLPDGTKIWALSVGTFGINILVKPSPALFASGVGLIAQVPTTSPMRVPALPDGSPLPAAATPHDRYHLLYEVLAQAWRVTDASTLFDYGPGKSTASYSIGGFPPESVPASIEDLDPTTLASARATCASVSDEDLSDECAYDAAVTGDAGFATLYQASDQFQSLGVATLDLAPGASPQPTTPPPGGGTASGVNLVEDNLSNVAGPGIGYHTLGPDGTIYVEAGEAGPSFGDVTPVLLAIDSATGKVRQRATPTGGGQLVFVAGSLWADAFKRPDHGCAVTRLDPVTLAVKAVVTAICGDSGRTLMIPFEDALWVVDPTGADANGKGGHLRRIDPATNAIDGSANGSVEMPFVSPFLGFPGGSTIMQPTSAGLIVGDPQHGYFRLASGSSAFDPLGKPDIGFHPYPAADGFWIQTAIGTEDSPESTAAFFNGGSTATRQLTVQLLMVGADHEAVYTSYSPSDDQADGLWRNPIDGSAPERIAVAAFEPIASGGQLNLTYRDPTLPLMIGDHMVVKLWVAPSPSDPDRVALYEQSIPVP